MGFKILIIELEVYQHILEKLTERDYEDHFDFMHSKEKYDEKTF